jgi:hypothetical protein
MAAAAETKRAGAAVGGRRVSVGLEQDAVAEVRRPRRADPALIFSRTERRWSSSENRAAGMHVCMYACMHCRRSGAGMHALLGRGSVSRPRGAVTYPETETRPAVARTGAGAGAAAGPIPRSRRPSPAVARPGTLAPRCHRYRRRACARLYACARFAAARGMREVQLEHRRAPGPRREPWRAALDT